MSGHFFPILPGGHFYAPAQPEILPSTLKYHDGHDSAWQLMYVDWEQK